MKHGMTLVVVMIVLSACTRTGVGLTSTAGSTQAAVAGAIIAEMRGGLIGGALGAKLDAGDRRTALQAEYRALEYTPAGEGVSWKSARAGVGGEVTAAQPYRVGSQDCRQYSHTVSQDSQKQTARGTACRNPDGTWTPLT